MFLQVRAGPAGSKQGAITPFANMKVNALKVEINYRNLDRNIPLHMTKNKKEWEKVLKTHLAGSSRCPALCFCHEEVSMSDLNLHMYEVCPVQPLHDCKGHIKNIWESLVQICDESEKNC